MFCVKQKTAYEMRISDWSSDGCSSDLYSSADIIHINFNDKFEQFSQEVRIASSNEGRLRYVLGAFYLHEDADSDRRVTIGQDMNTIVALPAGSPVPFAPVGLPFGEIGRASCRERGCQYG